MQWATFILCWWKLARLCAWTNGTPATSTEDPRLTQWSATDSSRKSARILLWNGTPRTAIVNFLALQHSLNRRMLCSLCLNLNVTGIGSRDFCLLSLTYIALFFNLILILSEEHLCQRSSVLFKRTRPGRVSRQSPAPWETHHQLHFGLPWLRPDPQNSWRTLGSALHFPLLFHLEASPLVITLFYQVSTQKRHVRLWCLATG